MAEHLTLESRRVIFHLLDEAGGSQATIRWAQQACAAKVLALEPETIVLGVSGTPPEDLPAATITIRTAGRWVVFPVNNLQFSAEGVVRVPMPARVETQEQRAQRRWGKARLFELRFDAGHSLELLDLSERGLAVFDPQHTLKTLPGEVISGALLLRGRPFRQVQLIVLNRDPELATVRAAFTPAGPFPRRTLELLFGHV